MDETARQVGDGADEAGRVGPGSSDVRVSEATFDVFRGIAAEYLRRERAGHTLQPTALVNEAFVRLGNATGFADRTHFVNAFARAMRNILVDHARARNAAKRGGGSRGDGSPVTIAVAADRATEGMSDSGTADVLDLIELDAALGRLEELDSRQARVVELRFFGGLGVRETAGLLGVSDRTVEADWRVARAWLRRELTPGDRRGDGA